MGERIALGFHTCVDYELIWDTKAVEDAIVKYEIRDTDLTVNTRPDNIRDLWITTISYLKDGVGGEAVPTDPKICEEFASVFKYKTTLGGTSARAALAIEKIGYSSVIEMNSYNHIIKELLPEKVKYHSAVGEDCDVCYPHISLTYNGGVRIHAGDIDFVTKRENRVLISHDIDSLNMAVKAEFADLAQDAEVFLMSCFSQVVERSVLDERLAETQKLLKRLPEKTVIVAEDGCYVQKDFRFVVHEALAPYIDIISMNEDELQEYIGKRIDILDAEVVIDALKYVYERIHVKTLVVHSADWALAYGENAEGIRDALSGAIMMAATRFRHGDDYGKAEFEETASLKDKEGAVRFCGEIKEKLGDKICCIPCKDLSFVENPTVVGLGDSFIGGMLPGLLAK